MDGQTSQASYPNPYAPPVGGGANAPTPAPIPAPAKRGVVGTLLIGVLIGLLVGGLAGYAIGQWFIFGPQREELQGQVGQLQTQVTTLEQQVATLKAGSGNSGTATGGTSSSGTGTAPTVSGVTPDPQTATWRTFSSTDFHFSFKYPDDYEVRTFQNSGDLTKLNDKDVVFAAGIFKPGEDAAAGMVYVYKNQIQQGPTRDGIVMNSFVSHLPTTVLQKSAGAGLINDVKEQTLSINGTEGLQLTAVEGSKTEVTPGGSTYTGYFFENQFDHPYVVSYCDSDQSTQRNLVGCLFLTTFTVIR
ncbi:MAG: hypothetical protein U0514_02930 [Candidatus Andersenbacteria bacterium]